MSYGRWPTATISDVITPRFHFRSRYLNMDRPGAARIALDCLICPRKNAVSLAVAVDEVHGLWNFGQGAGFIPVLSLNLFKPVFHFERMHGESAFPLPFLG